MKQRMRVVGMIVAMLSLQGCFILTMQDVKDLNGHIAKAQAELQRLEYVRASVVDLHDQAAAARMSIEQAAALKGVDPAIPAPQASIDPATLAATRVPPKSMTRAASPRPTVEELQGWLEELNQDIQRGIKLEQKLPALERDLEALKARLAAIEASPAGVARE